MDLKCTTTEEPKMTKDQIACKIIENAHRIAEQIKRGKDIEIKTCSTGIKFQAVEKKVI